MQEVKIKKFKICSEVIFSKIIYTALICSYLFTGNTKRVLISN